ncbi:MAG: DUF3080 family protein [Gammaproteobacteria bacterium]|nr:DUF3080 family protein [Gammaproteobacteria bacterium]
MRSLWLLLLLLGGCSVDPQQQLYSDYRHRLLSLLKVASPPLDASALAKPKQQPAPAALSIRLSQAWHYRHCGLLTIVGERNSSLGKVMVLSQRAAYERRLLATLSHCRTRYPASSSENQQLTAWYHHKQHDWPQLLLALATDNEMRSLWHDDGLPRRGDSEVLALLQVLAELRQVTAAQSEPLLLELEQQMAANRSNRYLGQLWRDANLALSAITDLNQRLAPAMSHVVCVGGRPSAHARQLRQFLDRYFGGRVQPELNRLLTELDRTEQALAAASISPLLEQPKPSRQLRNALQQHVRLWQQLLERCQLSPSRLP